MATFSATYGNMAHNTPCIHKNKAHSWWVVSISGSPGGFFCGLRKGSPRLQPGLQRAGDDPLLPEPWLEIVVGKWVWQMGLHFVFGIFV